MYDYAKLQNGTLVRFDIRELLREYPNKFISVLSDKSLNKYDVYIIHKTPKPGPGYIETLDLVDGKCKQLWTKTTNSREHTSRPAPSMYGLNDIANELDEKLNTFARQRGYDNIASACSYFMSSIEKYKQDAEKCIELRDRTWLAFEELADKIRTNEISMPKNFDDISENFPKLTWSDTDAH